MAWYCRREAENCPEARNRSTAPAMPSRAAAPGASQGKRGPSLRLLPEKAYLTTKASTASSQASRALRAAFSRTLSIRRG